MKMVSDWLNANQGSIVQYEEIISESRNMMILNTLQFYWFWGVPGLIIYFTMFVGLAFAMKA
ncbi:hypothetical protein [Desulfonatronum parangueonense]